MAVRRVCWFLLFAACASSNGSGTAPDGAPARDDAAPTDARLTDASPIDAPPPDACVPNPSGELCNGLDDDCDGVADDGLGLGLPCDGADADSCADGTYQCDGAGNVVCSDDAISHVELCNGMDDDCDGTADNGFALGVACDGADADLCADGVTVCDVAGTGVVCDDDTTEAANVETCNGADDNCNGVIDEGFGVDGPCDGGDSDSCARGHIACNGAGGTTCVGDSPNSTELCNNADDDCDGVIDNGFDKTSDINNCGSCGTHCVNGNGSTTCSNSACAPSCNAYYGDMDGNPVNGCECNGTTMEPSNLVGSNGGNWVNLGNTYSDCDHYHSWLANLVPTTDDDFYEAYITDDTFCVWETKAYLSQVPTGADYDLQVYKWDGANWIFQAQSINGGNANEKVDMSSYGEGWYGFHVIHYAGASCANYKLTLCDGSGDCGP